MQVNHQLVPKLKNLRLSGILATLEVRTQQAITEKLSYIDFLERLVEDEIERRAQKQLQLRLRRATVDLGKTLEGVTDDELATRSGSDCANDAERDTHQVSALSFRSSPAVMSLKD